MATGTSLPSPISRLSITGPAQPSVPTCCGQTWVWAVPAWQPCPVRRGVLPSRAELGDRGRLAGVTGANDEGSQRGKGCPGTPTPSRLQWWQGGSPLPCKTLLMPFFCQCLTAQLCHSLRPGVWF